MVTATDTLKPTPPVMKSTIAIVLALSLLASCKTPTYHYVPTTVNAIPYAGAGEGTIGLAFGSVGIALKGGIALSQNININAFTGGLPESDNNNSYTSKESEFSIGIQTDPHNNSVTGFYLGIGTGKNEKNKIGLSGNYNRPFLQVQHAAYDNPVFNTSARFDAYIGLRVNYLAYNGTLKGSEFDHDLFYYEPYFGFAIGGKNVRLELLQGLAIKNTGEWEEGVRIFPYFGSIGLTIKIRKNRGKQ
jgi:hypothetical protein